MKKNIVVFVFIVFFIISISSCKKEYICECTYTYNDNYSSRIITSTTEYRMFGKKNDVKTNCKDQEEKITIHGTGICELK